MKIKPLTLDGFTYLPHEIAAVREELVKQRNQSLTLGNFSFAVLLSHAHALLLHLEKNTSDE